MPLEVKAVLDRQVPAYLAGEVVKITVFLRNVHLSGAKSVSECVAWGSVQLGCERTGGGRIRDEKRRPTTSIAKSNTCVYSSCPTILFCDIKLAANEHKTFTSQIELPLYGLPPSFRGNLIRYYNRITIAVQHFNSPIKMLHIPIHVIPAVGIESKQPAASNPFLFETTSRPTMSEIVTATVDQITAPRKEYIYQMTNSSGKVGSLTLYKKAYKLGEDIIGKLSFQDAEVCCFQWSVHLETIENIEDDEKTETQDKKSSTVSWAMQHNVSADFVENTFRLPIPLHAPPTFNTNSVRLKWRLRFEFVTCKELQSTPSINAAGFRVWSAPDNVPIETLSWHVDLFVLACSPYNVALTDSNLTGSAILVI
ncbi:unnamed protein product, partial [Mesorhabditis belari]|uniref:RAB6A-GEF complex partner protein 2 n=1 Tax=Mesorhabditis belari TaxID=2138241 RepID=A0AAF3E937_9BILA